MHIVHGIMMLKDCRAADTDFIPTLQDNFVMLQTATDTTYFLQIHRLALLLTFQLQTSATFFIEKIF